MKPIVMNRPDQRIFWICLSLLIIILTGCSKESTINEEEWDGIGKNPKVAIFADAIHTDSLKSIVLWLQGKSSRFMYNSNRKQIAKEIKDRFVRLGYLNTRIDSFFLSDGFSFWQYNVIARLEGIANNGKVFVAGAHYDSTSHDPETNAPGADDNASGVSGIIEIARVLKKNGFVPKSSIEFVAFGAEEAGGLGSEDYAKKAFAKSVDIVAMLNLDMISYAPSSNPDTWVLNIMNYSNSIDLHSRIVDCGKIYSKLTFKNDNSDCEFGDSYLFFIKGYKAVFFIADIDSDPFYHTVNDVAANCNFPYCREIVAVSCAYLVQENL
jgi:leucyl aminopeptidase